MTIRIDVFIYGFKARNAKACIDAVINNSVHDIHIEFIDQHPLDRSSQFLYENNDDNRLFNYRAEDWDSLKSPVTFRSEFLERSGSQYMALLTTDILVSKGWDEELVRFINDREDIMVSGSGRVSVSQYLFDVVPEWTRSDSYEQTSFIDTNFMFASTLLWNRTKYPTFVKQAGEAELFSLKLISDGAKIFSCPDKIYADDLSRNTENTYHVWSKEHNYNTFIDCLKKVPNSLIDGYMISHDARHEFCRAHNIDVEKLRRLPYLTNDVEYDPTELEFHDVDARRYIAGTNAIY
jgi:hypothetical protein